MQTVELLKRKIELKLQLCELWERQINDTMKEIAELQERLDDSQDKS